ncbi:MAG: AAA family ATPase [Oscillospiraceae bacterium]|nr:AAA family ATPase [Oscillospiraceae bacterium]
MTHLYFPPDRPASTLHDDCRRFADMTAAALLALRESGTPPPLSPSGNTQRPEPLANFIELWREVLLPRLFPQIEMSDFLRFTAMLTALPDLDSKYNEVFAALLNDKRATRPTLGLAAELFATIQPIETEDVLAAASESAFGLLFQSLDDRQRPLLSRPLAANPAVAAVLAGIRQPCEELSRFCTVFFADEQEVELQKPLISHEREFERVQALLAMPSKPVNSGGHLLLNLCGAKGAGKRFILKRAAFSVGKNLLFVDLPGSREKITQIITRCMLFEMIPCFRCESDSDNAVISEALMLMGRNLPLIAICSTSDLDFTPPPEYTMYSLEVGTASIDKQKRFWEYFAEKGGYAFEDFNSAELVMSYDLTAGVIRDVLKLASVESAANSSIAIKSSDIANAVREKTRTNLSNLAVQMRTGFTWDDLILGDEAERMLRKVCVRVRRERMVNGEWGLGAKLPYGRGVTLLMYGPPGTGKTMAAQVLANELGRDLYRIELSRMVSKYIGETEKNLGMVFDSARGSNAILFFDEADALFSKRSEVKDSRDKHANTGTSYLLQRLEEHNGVSILATNNATNIDNAFKRRINYYVNIEAPCEKVRLLIWQSLITSNLPLSPSVNLELFASRFELTGSEIKSVLLEAAYMAAESGGEITRELLMSAIKDECKKNGRVLSQTDVV